MMVCRSLICGGQFIAWATNIIHPGPVNVTGNGLIQFSGQNVDLSRSVLTFQKPGDIRGDWLNHNHLLVLPGTANPDSVGGCGWN